MIHLRYDRGSLLIEGEVGTPYGRWDPRVGAFRAMALHYPEVLKYLDRSRLPYRNARAVDSYVWVVKRDDPNMQFSNALARDKVD